MENTNDRNESLKNLKDSLDYYRLWAFNMRSAVGEAIKKPLEEVKLSLSAISNIRTSSKSFGYRFITLGELTKEVTKRMKLFVEQTPKHILTIAQHGWFLELDCDINMPSQIVTAINTNNLTEVDNYLSNYYKQNLLRIFMELSERYPNRKEIFSEIQKSHDNQHFLVSIPTTLSQIDGICFDTTKSKFFLKDRSTHLPQVTAKIERYSNSLLNLYLSPLKGGIPMTSQEKRLGEYPSNLNRHEILHGVTTNYGTEINSFKCISLLKYISDILEEIKESMKDEFDQ